MSAPSEREMERAKAWFFRWVYDVADPDADQVPSDARYLVAFMQEEESDLAFQFAQARAEGYHAGIEAAAKLLGDSDYATHIRALAGGGETKP